MKGVIYARYSSDRQDSATIETQLNECRKKAESLNIDIVDTYVDEGKSARTDERPSFQRLLQDSKKKMFEVVIVRKYDRFARNVMQSKIAKNYLHQQGVKVISCHEETSSDPAGQFMETLLEAVAEWYSANLSTETKAGQTTNAKKGFRNGGTAPYGYRNIKVKDESTSKMRTKLEINEEEANAVRIVFDLFNRGVGYTRIIDELMSKGYKPRTAKNWNKNVLANMLVQPVYKGVLVWNGNVEAECDAIVDADTWNKAAEKRKSNCESNRGRTGSDRPFTGIAVCKYCGASYVSSNGQENVKLVCSNKRLKRGCENAHYVDERRLMSAVKKTLLREVFIESRLKQAYLETQREMQKEQMANMIDISKYNKELAQVDKKQKALLDAIENGIDFTAVKERLNDLAKQKEFLKEEIAKAQKDNTVSRKAFSSKNLQEYISYIRALVVDAEGAEFREAMKILGIRVEISDSVEIKMALPFGQNHDESFGAGNPLRNGSVFFIKMTQKIFNFFEKYVKY